LRNSLRSAKSWIWVTDFPTSILGQYHIEAIHPDDFIARLCDESFESVLQAMRLHRASLKKPPKTPAEYLDTLERCQIPLTAERLRPHADAI
jgi:hypothetical protein